MKLILRQYLLSLKERDELDVILPDLVSQLGLNVFSRPTRGTRQDGVDVAAVGSLDEELDAVFLFSIKAGNLTRTEWNGPSHQALRPSLDEILDSYIPNRLPPEHRAKNIVICIVLGGDVHETVRPLLSGYISTNTRENIRFQEWNGDKLASRIQSSFLREEFFPNENRAFLRKALAMLDEPETSYRHFSHLIATLSETDGKTAEQHLTAIRQMSLCLWILFAWAREAKNLEAAYRAGELTLLHAWKITRLYRKQTTNIERSVQSTFNAILQTYSHICDSFFSENVIPYADRLHGLSVAAQGESGLDVNLKLFDLLGRLGTRAAWTYHRLQNANAERDVSVFEDLLRTYTQVTKEVVNNNPALLACAHEDQAIDIMLAAFPLALIPSNSHFLVRWFSKLFENAKVAYLSYGRYPSLVKDYRDLLEHPRKRSEEYRQSVTSASILYPTIALWAALLNATDLYSEVAKFRREYLAHCTFQFWYPDETSEGHLYDNSDVHGATLTNPPIEEPPENLVAALFDECSITDHFYRLSAVESGLWPLILVACRHYRLPMPLHLLQPLASGRSEDPSVPSEPHSG